jgi:hypothetical protein
MVMVVGGIVFRNRPQNRVLPSMVIAVGGGVVVVVVIAIPSGIYKENWVMVAS